MATYLDPIQDYILEKIEKAIEEPGKSWKANKWAEVLAHYNRGAKDE